MAEEEAPSEAEQERADSPASARIRELERANREKAELLARERQLRARLEAAHLAKDRLLAVLSHDLRAPLNAVLGWTQLLRRERLDERARDRALATIERNARLPLALIEELLDISQLATGRVQVLRAPIDLRSLLRSAADAVAAPASRAGITLSVATPDEPLSMSGDRRRMDQVLANLLSNALESTPPGGRITLRLVGDAHVARIVVEDTGRGIGPELLVSVFQPVGVDLDYVSSNRDLGLGLYFARQAVEMHGGTVAVESEGVGRGARFTLTLPLLSSPDDSSPHDA